MSRKLCVSIQDAIRLAVDNGGKCLSTSIRNQNSKLKWKCANEHVWETRFSHVKKGHWCPFCARCARLDINDAKDLAKRSGGKCLSSAYKNNRTKMLWKCGDGHQWYATYDNISKGKWCPYCAGNCRKTIKDAKDLAIKNGGTCLSTSFNKYDHPLKWGCKDGHIWSTKYATIRGGSWCPACSYGKSQKLLFSIVKDIFSHFNVEYNYSDFEWLKTENGGKQRIDIFVYSDDMEFTLAIEYDGIQHFEPVRFGGKSIEEAKEILKYTKKMDKIKEHKIHIHKNDVKHLVRIKYSEELSEKNILRILGSNKKIAEGILSD